MDIMSLVRTLSADGTLTAIARNPRAQFGTRARRYLGAEVLPERLQPQNEYTEEGIKFRTVVANAGTRYSPVQIKGGAMVGTMRVSLAESDIGSHFTSRDLDALIGLLQRNMTMQAAHTLTNFLNVTINLALIEILEVWRWQAIINAVVLLRGDNEYTEDVAYSNPSGHRVNVATAWSDPAVDPFEDIFAGQAKLAEKGFGVSRQFTSSAIVSVMAANPNVAKRTNRVTVDSGGQIQSVNGRPSRASINAALAEDGLPPIETYDLRYNTSTGSNRFFEEDAFVMVATTGRDESIDLGQEAGVELLPDTLGYTGVGRPAGQSDPGRVIISEFKRNKPPRIDNEGWQTGMPVIVEPEGIFVMKGILP